MSSPAVSEYTVESLFTVGSPSTSGQVEASVVAGLYFIPCLALVIQLPACKGKYHPVISTALFAAARGVGYVFRALAEHSVTKVNFEASLILSSAATFLFIGALGHLLAHWFLLCSDKGHMGFTLHVGMHKRRISYVTAVEPLNYLGVAFAIVGVIAALRLFDASTFSELSNAQHGRAISNRGFLALMVIYTFCAMVCTLWSWFKGPTAAAKTPSRMLVISRLLLACICLLLRTVIGLLSVEHHQFTNEPKLLYTLEVLPEMLALYIVAMPGFVAAIGRDSDAPVGSVPTSLSLAALHVKIYPVDEPVSQQEEISHDKRAASHSHQGYNDSALDHLVPDCGIRHHPRATGQNTVIAVHRAPSDQGEFGVGPNAWAGDAPLIQQQPFLQNSTTSA